MIKDLKNENTNPVVAITTKLWSVFDILRGQVGSDNYSLLLFLLSIVKDQLIDTSDLNQENVQDRILKVGTEDKYKSIWLIYNRAIIGIDEKVLVKILQLMSSIDINVLKDNFPEIFDTFLYKLAATLGKRDEGVLQPLEISRFIISLANLPKNSSVYNPFAGLASFGVFLDTGQDYFGQEINSTTWALGSLRLMAYERSGYTSYRQDDSFDHWPSDEHKFDLIVSNPPFGLRLNRNHLKQNPEIRTAEQLLIEKGIHSLTASGKLIALIPQGFLFRDGQDKRLRKVLIESDLIEMVISFPSGMLLSTGVPIAVFVINKSKTTQGQIKFIDAKRFVGIGMQSSFLNSYKELSTIVNSDKESDSLRIATIDQIRSFDYSLHVPKYFQKEYEGTELSKVIETIKIKRAHKPDLGKLIRIRDLKDDNLDFYLKADELNDVKLRPDSRIIEESCLLLSIRWKTIKPTFFKYKGSAIYLSPDTRDIIAFSVKESIVNIGYLINELHADYVKEQLESNRIGGTIPYLRKDDLVKIKIKLPSLQEQIAKAQGLEVLSQKIKTLQQERNALAHGKTSKHFNEFASLKHTLGRPRQNILDWTDNLLHFLNLQREDFEALNKAFADFYEKDVFTALKETKRDINFITDVLEKGESGFVLEKFEKKLISLSAINKTVNELSDNGFNFKLKKFLIKGDKLKERGVYCNIILFKTLLDNLLTNASKHGFSKKEIGNEVVVELTEVEGILSMEVRNNGKPFPKNFDREKFITKYSTADTNSGTGLGGYDIHRIASGFNNPEWKLTLNVDPIYPVKFKFQFPIKLTN